MMSTRKLYEKMGVKADITPFIEDMAEAYEWADLVICRSGALTVAELAAAGMASIMVPYLYAVDDHQTANAKYLSDAGAAILMPQNDLTKESLSTLLNKLCGDRNTLIEMSIKARKLSKPHATEEVAAICAEYAGYEFKRGSNDNNSDDINDDKSNISQDPVNKVGSADNNEEDGWETFIETIDDGNVGETITNDEAPGKGVNYEAA